MATLSAREPADHLITARDMPIPLKPKFFLHNLYFQIPGLTVLRFWPSLQPCNRTPPSSLAPPSGEAMVPLNFIVTQEQLHAFFFNFLCGTGV
jgi:hypothetical protein